MAVLLLRGTSLDEGWFLSRSTIDAVLEQAECDVFVENLGTQSGDNALYIPDVDEHTVASLAESETETIESILLPVGTGPHSALAAEAARAVATAADAPVTVLHVIDADASGKAKSDATDLLKFAEYVLGPDVTVDTEIQEAADTTDIILEKAQKHDFTSIGAPEQQSRLESRVFESVQQTLTQRSDVTVLMARDSDRAMRSLYYRWKQGMDAMEDSNGSD
ncbi:MAG: universal stress protein [Halobacteria archaeon]